ncbi:hypothetical protein KDA11_06620 [Candidatus Saccharibacteria bacterium]|nr:hypothetical protein [Candidatus Saccharibacteria bacterium]
MYRLESSEAIDYSKIHSPLIGIIRELAKINGKLPKDALNSYANRNTYFNRQPVGGFLEFLTDEHNLLNYVITPLPMVSIYNIDESTEILTAFRPASDSVTAIFNHCTDRPQSTFSATLEQGINNDVLYVVNVLGKQCSPYNQDHNHPLTQNDTATLYKQLYPILTSVQQTQRPVA